MSTLRFIKSNLRYGTFGRQTLNGFLCHVSFIISMPGTSPVELSYTTSELSGVCLSPFPIWLGLGLH